MLKKKQPLSTIRKYNHHKQQAAIQYSTDFTCETQAVFLFAVMMFIVNIKSDSSKTVHS